MSECCKELKWRFVADANHADGAEFTIGKCENCGAYLIHVFHTAIVHEGYYVAVEEELVERILQLEGSEQKEFMRDWYRRQ